jgi:hypothetical protein
MFVCAPFSRADEWNKKTVITIDKEVQLPNTDLQPGTYVFKLANSSADRHIVQIFNKEETKLITTILAIPNYRLQATGKTVLSFWETPAGEVPAVRAWFYPGDLYGQEFAYPKNRAMQVASYAKASVPTTTANTEAEMKTAPITETNQNGQSSELDQNTYRANAEPAPPTVPEPAPQPVQQAANNAPPPPPAPAPQAAPAPAQQELPHTASSVPLIGLLGLISFSAFFALRRSAKVR